MPLGIRDPIELLKQAFAEHDAVLFRRLLERHPEIKAKINEPVAAFDAPLITRVRSREMLDVLLEAGADINAKSRWWAGGFGLLHGAEPELATYAIQRGAVVDAHAAARLGLIDRLRELISTNPSLVHAPGGDGQTPLHFASTVEVAKQFGHEEVFRLLMDHSPADVRLIAACWMDDERVVKSVIAEHPDLVAVLSGAYRRHVAHAARNNNLAAVRLLLAAGLPVDARGQHGATPLHWAAFHGNAGMARELLRCNPPLELVDADFNLSPLGWAIYGSEHGWYCRTGDYASTVEALLQAGAGIPENAGGTEPGRGVLRRS